MASALGSLCTKMCESFSWNCNCNSLKINCCSNTTVILGNAADPAAQNILKNQNLPHAMSLAKGQLSFRKVKMKESSDNEDLPEQARAGICFIRRDLAEKMEIEEQDSEMVENKLRLVAILSNIDIVSLYASGKPVTADQFEKMKKDARNVNKFYKAAIYLRMEVSKANFDLTKLMQDKSILTEPLKVLSNQITLISKERFKSNLSFWNLEPFEQKILLIASMKFKDKNLEQIDTNPDLIAALSQQGAKTHYQSHDEKNMEPTDHTPLVKT